MKESFLPKKTLLLWQIRFAIIGFIIIVGISIFTIFTQWIWIITSVLLVFLIFSMFWYLPRYFSSFEVKLPDGAIIINKGVFIKISNIMPYSKMVYAESYSTPLAGVMGLAAMSVKAARSTIIIPEISVIDANKFIDAIAKEKDK